jgi:type IX secretion system PorP/SprF family membrane protein
MKKILLPLIAISFNLMVKAQQIPIYSQYYWNDFIINPAFTGIKNSQRIQLGYRNQWSGFQGAPKTLNLGGHTNIRNTNMGIGGVLFSDDQGGAIKQNGIMLNYSYNLKINNESGLNFGIAGILNQYGYDGSSVQNINPDATLQTGVNQTSPDLNFGMVYHLKNRLYVGIAVNQLVQSRLKKLNQFNFSENQLIRHYNLTASYHMYLNQKINLEPYVLLRSAMIKAPQIELGTKISYNNFVFGALSYRGRESVIGMLGANYKNFIVAYSYDLNLSEIRNYSNGSHEILLAYQFKGKDKNPITVNVENENTDLDNDGIVDIEDACPETPGSKEGKGCPDTDSDGVFDNMDGCISQAGPKENKGCPYADTGGDGLNDAEDTCPKTAGPINNKGCPIIAEKEKEIIDIAFKSLEFETNSSNIQSSSFPSLNNLANLLIKNKSWNLLLEGHTDNVGNDKLNLEISKNRAEAVQKYLIENGVSIDRLKVKYYGETKPIADNNSIEGRQKNRRVEFKIVFE